MAERKQQNTKTPVRILITGGSGFIGSRFIELVRKDRQIDLFILSRGCENQFKIFDAEGGLVDEGLTLEQATVGCEIIIHFAGKASESGSVGTGIQNELFISNVLLTESLAKAAVQSKVKQFIFLSSAKIYGNSRQSAIIAEDYVNPQDNYAISKLHAETVLESTFSESTSKFVIVRAPLVYGPNSKGKFSQLVRLVESGVPLPVKGINNKRSMIYVDNLIDFILYCIHKPVESGKILLPSDGDPVSTLRMVEMVSAAVGATNRSFYLPSWALRFLATICGKRRAYNSFAGSLFFDSSAEGQRLGWVASVRTEEGFRRCFEKGDIG